MSASAAATSPAWRAARSLLALALLLDTAIGLAIAVVAALFARSVAIAEERYLEARFGDEYRAYRERVRRWI